MLSLFDKEKNRDILILSTFIIVWVFLFWRCRYGFVSNDEAFYITLPVRYLKGDALFVNEWHRAQLSGLVEIPLSFVDNFFFDSEGIVLRYRYYFTFFYGLFAYYIYNRLKSFNKVGAFLGAHILMLYTPFSIMAFSYNSFGIMFLTLIFTLYNTHKNNIDYIVIGILFALSVLSCPFLVILFLIYCGYFVLKKNKNSNDYDEFIYSLIGLGIVFIIFLIFIFSRSSISKIIECIPHILNDKERIDNNIFLLPYDYIKTVLDYTSYKKYIYIAYLIEFIIALLDKNRVQNRYLYLFSSMSIAFIDLLLAFQNHFYINNIMYSISMLGPTFLLFDEKRIKRLLWFYWLPAMLYTVLLYMSSNTGFHAISSAAVVADVSIAIMLSIAVNDCKKSYTKNVLIIITSILLISQIGFELHLRYMNNFGTDTIQYQNEYIDYGIQKGLFISESRKNKYDEYYSDILSMDIKKGSKVLFFSKCTWLYLIDKSYQNASYSAWLSADAEKIIPYYQINPDKVPEYIYIYMDDNYYDVAHKLNELLNYKEYKLDSNNIYYVKAR